MCVLRRSIDSKHQLAGSFAVEGEDGHAAELAKGSAEEPGGFDGQKETVDAVSGEGSGYRSVGGDEYRLRLQPDRVDQGSSVGLTTAGGDDDLDAGGLGLEESTAGAVAYLPSDGWQ